MKIPLKISAEWHSLGTNDNVDGNLRSIELIREWLQGAERVLRQRGSQDKDPVIYGHDRSANVAGVTSQDFDGIKMATLHAWHRWWSDPSRDPHGREEAGRDPAGEAAKVRAEIEARGGSIS